MTINVKIWNSCKWFWFSSHRDRIDMLANRVRQFANWGAKEGMCEITPKIIPTTSHPSTRETLMHNNHGEHRGAVAVVFNRSAVIAGRQKKKPRREPCSPFHESSRYAARCWVRLRRTYISSVSSSSCRHRCRRRRRRRHHRRRRRLGWLKGVESRARGCRLHKGRIRTIMRVTPCAYPVCGYARKLHAPEDIYSEPQGRIIEKTSPRTILTLAFTRLRGRKLESVAGKESRGGRGARVVSRGSNRGRIIRAREI